MEKYYYKVYTQDLLADWNLVISNSLDSWVYHDMYLCEFLAQEINGSNYSLVFYNADSNEPIAVCPLFIYTQESHRRFFPDKKTAQSFYTSGLAIVSKYGKQKRVDLIRYASDVLKQIVKEKGIDICRIASANLSEYCLTPATSYINPFHELRGGWLSEAMPYYYLDLSQSVEELKSNLGERPRAMINKLEKKADCVVRKATPQDLDVIHELHIETARRVGMFTHPKSNSVWWFNYSYAEHYVAVLEGVVFAVIRIVRYKNTAYYAAGFSKSDKIEGHINRYLLWHCLLLLKADGIRHFDVGIEGFFPEGSKEDNIAKFKSSFKGELRYRFSSVYEHTSFFKKALKKIINNF